MLHFFLNPWMLIGLTGVLLPVLAHLLSRKKYDTVEWGAMQFLELDPSAKRKLRLEELLLLAVRMGLVALLTIALARPWVGGQWLGRWASMQSRDVVLVIDCSYSMGWEGKATTPHAHAVRLARQFVDGLRPGDSMMVLDAREQPRPALPGPTRDRQRVREALESLPTPSGTANLFEAVSKAVQLLASGTNLQREVVVFTDRQSLSWKPDDDSLWARLDDQLEQASVKPRVWVIDAAEGQLGQAANFTIDRLRLSRELAVPGVPVRISSKVRYSGGDGPITRKVYLEVNGQRLADQTLMVRLQPKGEATVEFEQRFTKPGSQLVSVVLDGDALPGDNRSDAVIVVADSLPVVLVDGDKRLDPTRSETFFAKAALTASGAETSWIKASVIVPDEVSAETLRNVAVLVLANVGPLTPDRLELFERFVASGRGLIFTLGDKVPLDGYAADHDRGGKSLLPVKLKEIITDTDKESLGVRVAGNSLELPWLKLFRADQGGTLIDARFSKWWRITLAETAGRDSEAAANENEGANASVGSRLSTRDASPSLGTPIVIAKLTNGDPWIVTRRYGRGTTVAVTSSLDADWNTLPAKPDFVPWLHELLFATASPSTSRNVDVGTPLILAVAPELKAEQFELLSPALKPLPAELQEDEFQPTIRLNDTTTPGVYRFAAKANGRKPSMADEHFVANFDREESDLSQLTDQQQKQLTKEDRITSSTDLSAMETKMYADSSRAELWWILIYGFLAMMAIEVWMTRRMLHGAQDFSENQ